MSKTAEKSKTNLDEMIASLLERQGKFSGAKGRTLPEFCPVLVDSLEREIQEMVELSETIEKSAQSLDAEIKIGPVAAIKLLGDRAPADALAYAKERKAAQRSKLDELEATLAAHTSTLKAWACERADAASVALAAGTTARDTKPTKAITDAQVEQGVVQQQISSHKSAHAVCEAAVTHAAKLFLRDELLREANSFRVMASERMELAHEAQDLIERLHVIHAYSVESAIGYPHMPTRFGEAITAFPKVAKDRLGEYVMKKSPNGYLVDCLPKGEARLPFEDRLALARTKAGNTQAERLAELVK